MAEGNTGVTVSSDPQSNNNNGGANPAQQATPAGDNNSNTPQLPEGFSSVEELATAYTQLKGSQEQSPETTPKGDEKDGDSDSDDLKSQVSDLQNRLTTGEIFKAVGGEDKYSQLTDWASENLPEGEVKAFNDVMASGNQEGMLFAVRALQAIHQNTMDQEPVLNFGNNTKGMSGYRSQAELNQAIADPRYYSDPAYREEVEHRVALSTF
ncbi:capsid assembly protein [Microbulbifer sp. ZKSA002]|uniref:capsid assembly protein n=1 Tax=Microbulbifer sp. ZKSA002 TaxID=3243388 RepID=UPI004039F064